MPVIVSTEGKRGCGYRQEGGIYLIAGALMRPCGRLPIPLIICPTCGRGFRQTRGLEWVDGDEIKRLKETKDCQGEDCDGCCLADDHEIGQAGLLWVGECFYPTPRDYIEETWKMGISKRIPPSAVKGIKVGETVIFLAHPKTISKWCECTKDGLAQEDCPLCGGKGKVYTPGIFGVFIPERIEKVVDEGISMEEIEKLEKQGIQPVIVRKKSDRQRALTEEGVGQKKGGENGI